MAIRIDSSCLDAIDFIMQNKLISNNELKILLRDLCASVKDRNWLQDYYKNQMDLISDGIVNLNVDIINTLSLKNEPEYLIRNASYYYNNYQPDEAYRLSRQVKNIYLFIYIFVITFIIYCF